MTDNVDQNLGLHFFVDGAAVDNITIAINHSVDYVASDSAGNTATSTRTVIVGAIANAPALATTTPANDNPALPTEATGS